MGKPSKTHNGLIMSKIAREAGVRWGFHAIGIPCMGHTFKDSLPAIHEAMKLKTAALRPAGSSDSLGLPAPIAPLGAPPRDGPGAGAGGAPAVVGGPGEKKSCCVIS
eukprot:NODE_5171_length_607_cov_37.570652.p2 GENE.NODE_5171_length_607_cov_37.570652~~NODE_5171_length_607_cov_37.570652.p2  ORF type:complete len:107 (+),score=10.25 NODE_5171_length_607_cov_37.570652:3-323(+)